MLPWPQSPSKEDLSENIHVWWLRHDENPPPDFTSECLDEEEARQASRFGPETARTSFLWRRWLRREVVSRYAGIPPKELRFRGKRFEKPLLPDLEEIQFSTTSRSGIAGIAITLRDALGLDLETLRDSVDLSGLANKFFRADELAFFNSAQNKADAFARVWTVKEAYLKMKGTGLAGNPRTFQLPDPSGDNVWMKMAGEEGTHGYAYPTGIRGEFASCLVTESEPKVVHQFLCSSHA